MLRYDDAMGPRHPPLALVVAAALLATLAPLAAQERSELAAGDQVAITVRELPAVSGDTVTIGTDGGIELPEIGRVLAAGRTPEDLEGEIQRRLEARGLRRATVEVVVVSQAVSPVLVIGAVARPGPQTVIAGTPLLDVLFAAGGLSADHGGEIRVRRTAPNGLVDQVTVPAAALLERADPAVDLPLVPGDVVTVPAVEPVTISFLGEVGTTGSLTFTGRERVTLLMAVARAGGLTETASNRIRILRTVAGGERQELTAHWKRILAGSDPDVELQDGDIVVVKESFF